MNVAVIPARGGSKRIPRKNIRLFHGKPIIAWSIEAAQLSGCFERIIVSTDDVEIADVAKAYGAEIPFMRPKPLSDDHTGTIPVVTHAIGWLREHGIAPLHTCCIYATAPFIQAPDLRAGLDQLVNSSTDFDYVFSVTKYPFPIQRAIRITNQGTVQMFDPKQFNTRSQDLEDSFHDAGQFYWGRSDAWIVGKVIFGHRSAAIRLPTFRVQDIDTIEDWERAEQLFRILQSSECIRHQEG